MNDPKYIGCFVRDNGKIFSNIEAGVPIDKVWEHGQFSANTLKQAVKLYIGGEMVKTFQPDGRHDESLQRNEMATVHGN